MALAARRKGPGRARYIRAYVLPLLSAAERADYDVAIRARMGVAAALVIAGRADLLPRLDPRRRFKQPLCPRTKEPSHAC